MSGYIGSKASVTLVDGYNRTEADAEFVQDPNGAITVSGSNVGIGTDSPSEELSVASNISATNLYVTSGGDTSSKGISGGFKHGGTNSKSLVITADPDNVGGNTTMQFHVDATEAMRIDAAGRVTMPYQPIVNCGISDHNTSVAHAGAGISALYTTGHPSVVVQGGMIVSSDRVTVPVAGKYLVSARQLNQSNTGEYFNIRLNGTAVGYGYNSDTGPLHDITVDAIVSCAANDYIQISYNTATANRWESGHSNLMIHLIG